MDMKARLLPITGIGSLPHTDIESAVEYSLKYDIPFLPELTKREDSMRTKSIRDLLCFKKFSSSLHPNQVFKTQSFYDLETRINENQIHFIDDPAKTFNLPFKELGLHCCNKIEIEDIEDLKISHLSFDARFIDHPSDYLSALISRGITPVVGILSTHGETIKACDNYSKWKLALRQYAMNCWLSPACGLSGFTEVEAEDSLQLLRSIQNEILQAHL